MLIREKSDQVLWMADCYSLAKRFPNCRTWMALLEPAANTRASGLSPYHYWLWMEIWRAAQPEAETSAEYSNA